MLQGTNYMEVLNKGLRGPTHGMPCTASLALATEFYQPGLCLSAFGIPPRKQTSDRTRTPSSSPRACQHLLNTGYNTVALFLMQNTRCVRAMNKKRKAAASKRPTTICSQVVTYAGRWADAVPTLQLPDAGRCESAE